MTTSTQLVANYPIISEQIKQPALQVVLTNLEKVLDGGIGGDIVEFGCYIGTTSLFLRRLLDARPDTPARQLHVYDSFAGLPAKVSQDNSPVGADFKAGELSVSRKQLQAEFYKARLQPPIIHKCWFSDLDGQPGSKDVPDHIAFGFLDGDFYRSIYDSLQLVWPRLQPGGIICFDDYQRDALPGVERAVRDYFQGAPPTVRVSHNIGMLVKS